MDPKIIKKNSVRLSITDGILTLLNSLISVGGIVITYITSSRFFYMAIVLATVLIVVTLIYLIVKMRRQKKTHNRFN